MNFDERFTRAVAATPEALREQLDSGTPLDWRALEEAKTGAELGAATRTHRRLPESVEALVHRLISDVGIVPTDLAAGVERQGSASVWIRRITMESDGDCYQLQNDLSGEVTTRVRPEAIAGYATLALELATAIHEAGERWIEAGEQWIEAGERYPATTEGGLEHLAQCAIRMCTYLRPDSKRDLRRRTTSELARTLERAWNSQKIEVRAKLSSARLSTARGACAPRGSYYAPMSSHRLQACNLGESRWLRMLAQRAVVGAPVSEPEKELLKLPRGRASVVAVPIGDEVVSVNMGTLGARIQAAETTSVITLGSDPNTLVLDEVLTGLESAAKHLPSAVKRRMGGTYGVGVTQTLARLQDPHEAAVLHAEMKAVKSGQSGPQWLEDLVAVLLIDTGAQTREGWRTASMRLDAGEVPGGECVGTEVETGAFGRLTTIGLVEQSHLSLKYAHDAWAGLTALQRAGKEAGWALDGVGDSEFSANECETLEAAQQIGQAFDGVHAHGERAPRALEQAAMAAGALKTVGPTVRTAAGWPGALEGPNARDPNDIARIATVSEALSREVRLIANDLIADRIASAQEHGKEVGSIGRASPDRR